MKLTATVIELISGSNYTNKQPRVKLKVAEADSCFRTFIVPNGDGLGLDDEVVMLVLTKGRAASVFEFADKYDSAAATLLADQLRPDPPVPFLADECCQASCGLGDELGDVDHKCLFRFDGKPHKTHVFSMSCERTVAEAAHNADTQEFRLGGAV